MARPRVKQRKRLTTTPPLFQPGQRLPASQQPHGGGGPENAGARSHVQAGISFRQGQPPHPGEAETFNEYGGYAAPSTKPNTAGRPANNFRNLGDNHGGRA